VLIVVVPWTALAQSPSYVDPDNGITFFGITDPVHSVTYGYVFPPLEANRDEFIGEIIAPIDSKWVGASPRGGMLNNLLLVAWANGDSIVASTRLATYVCCIHHPSGYLSRLLIILSSGYSLPGQVTELDDIASWC
jgi:hypothetical protein